MEQVGVGFTSSGSVLNQTQLEEQRRKRGECLTCGQKCFTKKLFKLIPITEHGRVLNGRCLECKPLDPGAGKVVIPAVSRRATQQDRLRFTQSQSRLSGPGVRPSGSNLESTTLNRRRSDFDAMRLSALPSVSSSPPITSQKPRSQSAVIPQNAKRVGQTGIESIARNRDSASPVLASKRGVPMSAFTLSPISDSYENSDYPTAEVARSEDAYVHDRESNRSLGSGRSANSVPRSYSSGRGTPSAVESSPPSEAYLDGDVAAARGVAEYVEEMEENDDYAPTVHGILNRGGTISFSNLKTVRDESNGALSASTGSALDEDVRVNGGRQPSWSSSQGRQPSWKHTRFADEVYEEGSHTDSKKSIESSSRPVTARTSSRNILVEEKEQRARDEIQDAGDDYTCRIKLMKEHPASAVIQKEAMEGLSTLELSDVDSDEILSLGGLDACVMGMRSHPHQVDVQINGCRAMWNLSLTTNNQVGLLKAGALDCVLTAMLGFGDDSEVQENALATIANLCAAEENQSSILENGTVEKIVETMNRHSEDPTVQSQGCAVISSLSSHDTDLKRNVMEAGAGGAVVISMIMHPEDVKLQEGALQALQNLCTNCDENLAEVGNVGGLDSTITAMQIHRDEPGVQEAGAWALSVLAGDAENKAAIGDCGGIDVVVRAMWVHSDVLGVQQSCCAALWKLTEDELNRNLVVEVGGISALVNAMQAYVDESTVQERSLGILTNLALDDLDYKVRIVEEEAVDAIVMAMVLHSEVVPVQKEACKSLQTLAIEQNVERLKAANVAELVRSAGEKFPMECGDIASNVLEMFN